MNIGQNIYNIRKAKGISKEDLACAVGISTYTLMFYETPGYGGHKINTLEKIAKELDVSLEKLLSSD